MSQLRDLARKFPADSILSNPSGGGSYVPHHLYVQRLLMHLGAYSFERVDIIRGDVPGKPPDPKGKSDRAKAGTPDLHDAIVGVVCRLSVVVDGKPMVIEDVGDCESPHNWPHDGARLKDAMSDALKRCCARIGLGTHLYAKNLSDYVLYRVLTDNEKVSPPSPGGGDGGAASVDPPVGSSESEEPAGVNTARGEASPAGVSRAGASTVTTGGTGSPDVPGSDVGNPALDLNQGRND